MTEGDPFLGADEKAYEFCLSYRRHDTLDDLGHSQDWFVVDGDWDVFRQNDVYVGAATGFVDVEIGDVRVSREGYGAGAVSDAVIWVG